MMIPRQRLIFLLAVVWLAYSLSFFHRFAPSGIASQLLEALNIPQTALGLLAGSYFFVYTLMQIPTGVILDAWGPRALLLWGGIIAGLGSLGFGLASHFESAFIARIMVGIGVSVAFLSMLKVYALIYPENHFSTMVGIGLLLGNLGSVFAGSPLSYLALIFDWRFIFIFLGGLSLLLGLLSWFAIPPALMNSPLFIGQNRSFSERMHSAWKGLILVVREPRSWPPTLVNGGMAGCFFGFGGLWLSPWLVEGQQLSKVNAGWIGTTYFLSFALGSMLLGSWSDRHARRKQPMMIASLGLLVLFLFITFAPRLPFVGLIALFVLLGLTTSGFTLTWANIKEINPPALSGTSTSFANMAGFLIGGIIQLLMGWVLDHQAQWLIALGYVDQPYWGAHRFQMAMGVLIVFALIGFLASCAVTETHAKNIYAETKK